MVVILTQSSLFAGFVSELQFSLVLFIKAWWGQVFKEYGYFCEKDHVSKSQADFEA